MRFLNCPERETRWGGECRDVCRDGRISVCSADREGFNAGGSEIMSQAPNNVSIGAEDERGSGRRERQSVGARQKLADEKAKVSADGSIVLKNNTLGTEEGQVCKSRLRRAAQDVRLLSAEKGRSPCNSAKRAVVCEIAAHDEKVRHTSRSGGQKGRTGIDEGIFDPKICRFGRAELENAGRPLSDPEIKCLAQLYKSYGRAVSDRYVVADGGHSV